MGKRPCDVANSKEQWVHFALVYDGKDVAYANGIEAGRSDDVTLNTPIMTTYYWYGKEELTSTLRLRRTHS